MSLEVEHEEKCWNEEILEPSLKRFKERKEEFLSPSGIPTPRVAIQIGRASCRERV